MSHSNIPTIADAESAQWMDKFVLVRVDYNAPLSTDHSHVVSDLRIKDSLETIQTLVNKGAKVVVCSHLGRPKGHVQHEYSLKVVWKHICDHELLRGTTVDFIDTCVGPDRIKSMEAMNAGDVLILENLRFHHEEEDNDDDFARELAYGLDFYVNDAFSVSHRRHASVCAITNHFQNKYAGLALNKEVYFLKGMLCDFPQHPMAAIIGGSKVSTKLELLRNLLEKVDKILIGGGMVFTFLKAMQLSTGDSIVEDNLLREAAEIVRLAAKMKKILRFATDIVVVPTEQFRNHRLDGMKVVSHDAIPMDYTGLDIGPQTIREFNEELDDCATVIWNGPMGMIEIPEFAHGTEAIIQSMVERHAQGVNTIACGGDTTVLIEKKNEICNFTHVSMGGGASLVLLSGIDLPGIVSLRT